MADDPTETGPTFPGPPMPSLRRPFPDLETLLEALLDYGLNRWATENNQDGLKRHGVVEDVASGVRGVQFSGVLLEKLGVMNGIYAPGEAVARMLEEITEMVRTAPVTINTAEGPHTTTLYRAGLPPEFLERFTIDGAAFAVYSLIAGAGIEYSFALRRNFRHARAFAVVAMQSLLSTYLKANGSGVISARIDVRGIIKELKKEAAKEDEEHMRRLLERLPHVIITGVKGRPPLRWTKRDLGRAVIRALRELPPSDRTLEGVYRAVSARDPYRSPKSAQAFKQLLYEKGLRLRALKEAAAKGRKRRTA